MESTEAYLKCGNLKIKITDMTLIRFRAKRFFDIRNVLLTYHNMLRCKCNLHTKQNIVVFFLLYKEILKTRNCSNIMISIF